VFSNRLHVLLLGLLNGAIPIALVGDDDNKIIGCFNKLGLVENLLFLSDVEKFDMLKLRDGWGFGRLEYFKDLGSKLEQQVLKSLTE